MWSSGNIREITLNSYYFIIRSIKSVIYKKEAATVHYFCLSGGTGNKTHTNEHDDSTNRINDVDVSLSPMQ